MLRELDYIEIKLAKAVPKPELLAEVSRLLGVDQAAMWDFGQPEEHAEPFLVSVTYFVDDDPAYLLFLTLILNQTRAVSLGFEIAFGAALAQRFDCAVLICDPSDPHGSPEYLLEIEPSGQVRSCQEEEEGQRTYHSISGLSGPYQEAIAQLQALVQRVGRLPWMDS